MAEVRVFRLLALDEAAKVLEPAPDQMEAAVAYMVEGMVETVDRDCHRFHLADMVADK